MGSYCNGHWHSVEYDAQIGRCSTYQQSTCTKLINEMLHNYRRGCAELPWGLSRCPVVRKYKSI